MTVNDTSFNVLLSYAYLGKGMEKVTEYIEEKSRQGEIDVMIDSGAFTKKGYELKGSHQGDWITLDNYCKWLDVHGNNFHKYVMMDKLGDDVQSRKNYEEMLKRGYNPMYVWTMFDKNYDYLKYAIDNNPEICVAGGGKNSDYIMQRYQQAYKISNGKANVHALAFFKFPQIYQLPILSSDAASWVNAVGRFHSTFAYTKDGCYKQYNTTNGIIEAVKNHDKYLIEAMKYGGVTVQDFRDDIHKNMMLNFYLSQIAITRIQQYAYKTKKLRLYLSGAQQLKYLYGLEYVNKHIREGGLNYREWKEIMLNN